MKLGRADWQVDLVRCSCVILEAYLLIVGSLPTFVHNNNNNNKEKKKKKEEKEEQEKEEGGRPDKDKQLNTNEQESKNERIPSVWVGYLQATPNIATHSDAPKAEPIAPLAKMMG